MSRRLGDVDKQQRKTRSDIGSKRKLYNGHPPKGRKKIRHERRKKGDKTILKLWIWEKCLMSKAGRLRWNKYTRPYASPYVFPNDRKLRIDVLVSQISNKEKMGELIAFHMPPGTFYVMGFSHGKNKARVKPVKLCEILVKETKKGNVGTMMSNDRLSRYWFWDK